MKKISLNRRSFLKNSGKATGFVALQVEWYNLMLLMLGLRRKVL